MKKELVVNSLVGLFVTIVAVAGTWFYMDQVVVSDYKSQIGDINNKLVAMGCGEKTKYVNSEYKFSLDFPSNWTGFEVVKENGTKEPRGGNDVVALYTVYLPTTNENYPNGKNDMFGIGVFTSSQWESNEKVEGGAYEMIGQTADYTIGYIPGTIEIEPDPFVQVSGARIHPVIDSFEDLSQ